MELYRWLLFRYISNLTYIICACTRIFPKVYRNAKKGRKSISIYLRNGIVPSSRRTSKHFISISSWHFCRLVADFTLENDAILFGKLKRISLYTYSTYLFIPIWLSLWFLMQHSCSSWYVLYACIWESLAVGWVLG